MRSVLLATLLATTATSALAAGPAQEKLGRAGDALSNPIVQKAAAAKVRTMVDALLETRLEPFARAIAPLDRGETLDRYHGRTLRDLAEDRDPYFEDRLSDGTEQAVGSAGALAKGLAEALPELEAAMRRLEKSLPRQR